MILWIVWVYLLVGIVASKVYARKFIEDAERGHPGALRLAKVRGEIGDEKFWTGFYVLTMLFYGLYVIQSLAFVVKKNADLS